MSMGITVEDFKYISGVNDSEYIELLKNAYERQKHITSKAIAKLKEQPEQKKGQWIRNDNGTYSCDKCHSWIPEEQHYYARYCLYCGADMRGEQNGKIHH